jgi:hypothetical protein
MPLARALAAGGFAERGDKGWRLRHTIKPG